MRCKARPSVRGAIEAFQQQRLVRLHIRRIEPPMSGVVCDSIGFTNPMPIDQVRWNKVRERNSAGVAHRERRIPQRTADRTPEVDHLNPSLKKCAGLVTQKVAYS